MKRRGYYIISPHGEARANILENDNLHIQVEFSAKSSLELYLKKANIILQKIDKRQCTAAKDVRMVGGKHGNAPCAALASRGARRNRDAEHL